VKRTIYTDLAALQMWWQRQPKWWKYTLYFAITATAVWLWGVFDDRPMIITERPY
jgi:hypothetical protein